MVPEMALYVYPPRPCETHVLEGQSRVSEVCPRGAEAWYRRGL